MVMNLNAITKIKPLIAREDVVSPNGWLFFPHGNWQKKIFWAFVSINWATRSLKGKYRSPNGSRY
jgi:hypothetical protein